MSLRQRGLTSACVSGAGQKRALGALGVPFAELLMQGGVMIPGWKRLHRCVCTEHLAPSSPAQAAGGACWGPSRGSDLMLLSWSPPAEILLWFFLLGCVSATSVCWAGWGGQSGAAAGEANQGRFLLQAQPPLGQREHLRRVLPVPLHAASSASLGELRCLTGCSRGGRAARAPRAPLSRAGKACRRGAAGGLVLESCRDGG